jgi:hypothetical protein
MAKTSPSSKAPFNRWGKRDTESSHFLCIFITYCGWALAEEMQEMPWRHLSALVADCGMTEPPCQATSTGIGGTNVPGVLNF